MALPGVSLTDRTPVLEDFTAPTLDVLQATARDAWHFSPSPAIARMKELSDAEQGDSPMLSHEEAMQHVGELPLTIPQEGIKSDALEILLSRKRTEIRRQSVLSRAEGGFAEGAARLTTGLAVSIMDPLNVAVSFVPIVGQAKYASMLARAGTSVTARAAVRAKVGAIEGAVGAALLEPIILTAASQEQADYGLMDSALNIAFGTVLGGGLHTSLGALADRVSGVTKAVQAASPETRENAMRAAMSQIMSGQKVEVGPVLNRDPWYSYTMGKSIERPSAMELDTKLTDRLTELVRQADMEEQVRLKRGDRKQLENRLNEIEQHMENPSKVVRRMEAADPEVAKQSNKAVKREALRKLEEERIQITEQLRQADAATARNAETKGAVGAAIEKIRAGEPLDPAELPMTVREAVQRELDTAQQKSRKQDLQTTIAAASRQGDYRNEWDFEVETDAHIQEQLKAAEARKDETALDEDMAELDQELQEVAEATGVSSAELQALDSVKAELDAELAEAQSILDGLKACRRTAT